MVSTLVANKKTKTPTKTTSYTPTTIGIQTITSKITGQNTPVKKDPVLSSPSKTPPKSNSSALGLNLSKGPT